MLPSLLTAVFLTICLTIFYGINLYNLKKFSAARKSVKYKAEVGQPREPIAVLAAVGTIIFFLESALYALLVFLGLHTHIENSFLQLRFSLDWLVQLVGMFLTAFGYFIFIWSVIVRGRYATSWAMPEDQKLVTLGPYRYVRHPSYLAYFILFAGLFLALLNLIAIIPFIAAPSYVHIATVEEKLLTERFGKQYLDYQHRTGMFFPKKEKIER